MSDVPNLGEWQGKNVRAADGEDIGSLEDVYFDSETDEAAFLLVRSGLLGRHLTLVPAQGVRAGQSYLQVICVKDELKQAPVMQAGDELSADEEARIYHYYGFEYEPAPSGRRLVRR